MAYFHCFDLVLSVLPMSGNINDPIEIIFNFDQLQHSFSISESCALQLFSLEDLQQCQKSGEISLSDSNILEDHVRMLSEENCQLVGTTLYGSLAESYPLIESLFPSDHNIYTTAQSRYLKQRISTHQQLCIYPIYSSRGIILIPLFLLFDFIRPVPPNSISPITQDYVLYALVSIHSPPTKIMKNLILLWMIVFLQ